MKTEELAAKLAAWATEFSQVTDAECVLPPKLFPFLANRLGELDLTTIDEDTVTVNMMGESRRVKITGTHGQFLCYDETGGMGGCGIVRMDQVASSDRGKITAILNRLSDQGRI